jgi:hypothetical protein
LFAEHYNEVKENSYQNAKSIPFNYLKENKVEKERLTNINLCILARS